MEHAIRGMDKEMEATIWGLGFRVEIGAMGIAIGLFEGVPSS